MKRERIVGMLFAGVAAGAAWGIACYLLGGDFTSVWLAAVVSTMGGYWSGSS